MIAINCKIIQADTWDILCKGLSLKDHSTPHQIARELTKHSCTFILTNPDDEALGIICGVLKLTTQSFVNPNTKIILAGENVYHRAILLRSDLHHRLREAEVVGQTMLCS